MKIHQSSSKLILVFLNYFQIKNYVILVPLLSIKKKNEKESYLIIYRFSLFIFVISYLKNSIFHIKKIVL